MSDSDQLLKTGDPPANQAEGSETAPSPPADPRQAIVQNLAKALHAAAAKIQRNLAGESVFENDGERKTAMDLVKLLPHLLPLIHRFRQPLSPDARFIPACPICRAKPGKHWAHECPEITGHDQNDVIVDYRRKQLLSYKDFRDPDATLPAVIPVCTICRIGLGHHWAKDCPIRRDCPEHNKAIQWQVEMYGPNAAIQDTKSD